MRKKLVTVSIILVVLLAGITGLWWHHHSDNKANASALLERQQMFGLSAAELLFLSPDQQLAELKDMKAMGITWIRYDISWNKIQAAGPDSYDWRTTDRLQANLQSMGFKSLAILDYTPPWARRSECPNDDKCAPKDPQQFAKFASEAVAHYKDKGISTWEIWNEPNLYKFWKPAPNASDYTQLLKAAAAAVRLQQPNAFILSGGCGRGDMGSGGILPLDFLTQMYAAGGGTVINAVSVHPYSFPLAPVNTWGDVEAVHTMMAKNGDDTKQVWVTEYGGPTGGPKMAAAQANPRDTRGIDHVSEAAQAEMMTDAVHAFGRYPWAGPFMWYNYKDIGTDPSDRENFYGLLRNDGTPKPAYTTYKQLIHSSSK